MLLLLVIWLISVSICRPCHRVRRWRVRLAVTIAVSALSLNRLHCGSSDAPFRTMHYDPVSVNRRSIGNGIGFDIFLISRDEMISYDI